MSSRLTPSYLQWLTTIYTKSYAMQVNLKAVYDTPGQRRSYAFGLRRPSGSNSSNSGPSFPERVKTSAPREEGVAPWIANKLPYKHKVKTNREDRSQDESNTTRPGKTSPRILEVQRGNDRRRPREPLPPIVVPKQIKEYVTPNIVFFHNPEVWASVKALKILEQAQIAYPDTQFKKGPPLPLNVKVERRLPTVEEVHDACTLREEPNWIDFLSGQASNKWRLHPTNARSVVESVELQRKAFAERPDTIPRLINPPMERATKTEDEDDDNNSTVVRAEKLDINDPLFGTSTVFAWPMIIWNEKEALLGSEVKRLRRLLIKLKHVRDSSMDPQEYSAAVKQIKKELLEARWAKTDRKEVNVPEDQALQWYKETDDGEAPRRKQSLF